MHNNTSLQHYSMEKPATIGILLTNLGTPAQSTYGSVRRFLKEFLSDPRVVELPRWIWWPILHGLILTTRPARSAQAYRKIWTAEGSPLLSISRQQAQALQAHFSTDNIQVALGMRYGEPSLEQALHHLRQHNAQTILLFPLYPQYSATTTASTFDAVAKILKKWRWLPELHTVHHYYTKPSYITALAQSVQQHWAKHGRAEKLLLSFHGLPQRCADQGDPYPVHCQATAQALAQALQLTNDDWLLTYQSRLGPAQWLSPYTDKTLENLAESGVKSIDVICPGFAADCLETLEEIALTNKQLFLESGGEHYHYIPALNADPNHIRCLGEIALQHLPSAHH